MHQSVGSHDLCTIDGSQRLMSKADSQRRNAATEFSDYVAGKTGLGRAAGPWGDDDVGRMQFFNLLQGHLIIPLYSNLGRAVDFTNPLHQIESE